jgi:glycosyltransferase involved in cell wall biosynthesis
MDKQKKILLVSNMYPSKKYPHYGVFVQNIEKGLIQSDFYVDGCYLTKESNIVIKLIKYILFYIKILFRGYFIKYDAIYAHYASHVSIPMLVLKKIKRNLLVIVNVHGNDIVPESKNDEKFIPRVKQLLFICDRIIAPSLYFQDILINEYEIDKSKIFVSPSGGVNHNIFYKQDRKKLLAKFNFDPCKIYIGYISRIEINKGWDTFLEACAIIAKKYQIEIIVVGSGDENSLFNLKINELNLSKIIHKIPLLSQKEIAEIYNILDVFCFPTRRKSESLGLVGLEAMACETIVVASSKYGPSSYMKNHLNGLVFNMFSAEDLSKKIEAVLHMSETEKNIMKKHAYQTSRIYDDQIVNNNLVNFFREVI